MARRFNRQLNKETATAFFDTKCWENMTSKERVLFQLEQDKVIMPFEIFYQELATLLNRKPTLFEIKQKNNLIKEINRVINVE